MRSAPTGGRRSLSAIVVMAIALVFFSAVTLAATVVYVYDELGRLVAEIDPAGETTRYTYDAAGNLTAVSRGSSSEFRVLSFAPSRGKAGDTITVFGSGFIANPTQNSVSINGTPATIVSATTTSLVVTVPSGATSGPISVTNANGTASSAQPFTVLLAAAITAVTPSAVNRSATTRIQISGTNMATARAVNFSQPGLTARIVPLATDTLLNVDLAVAPDVPVGAYSFSVVTDAGAFSSGSVVITVSTALLGDVLATTPPFSVRLPPADTGAPGNRMSTTAPFSVVLPAAVSGTGNSTSTTQPLSVHLPTAPSGGGTSNAQSSSQPLSVGMP